MDFDFVHDLHTNKVEITFHSVEPMSFSSDIFDGFKFPLKRQDLRRGGEVSGTYSFLINIKQIASTICTKNFSNPARYFALRHGPTVYFKARLFNELLLNTGVVLQFDEHLLRIPYEGLNAMISCQCIFEDNTDKFMHENPETDLIPEGYLIVTINEQCSRHKDIAKFLKEHPLNGYNKDLRVSIELLRKLEYEEYRKTITQKPKPKTRLGIIRHVY